MNNRKVTAGSVIGFFVIESINCIFLISKLINIRASVSFRIFVMALLFIIQAFSVYGIATDRSNCNFSFGMMHWIFVLIQFFYAPIVQISQNLYPWQARLTESNVITTLLVIVLWCSVFTAFYKIRLVFFAGEKSPFQKNKQVINRHEIKRHDHIQYKIPVIISLVITLFAIARFGSSLVSSRVALSESLMRSGQIFFLIYNTTLRGTVVMTAAICIRRDKKNKKMSIQTLLMLICCIILYFPPAIGRMWIMVIYLGLALVFYQRIKGRYTLLLTMLGGIVYFAAVIGVFRNATFSFNTLWNTIKMEFDINKRMLGGDFDCFVMVAKTIQFVQNHGITFGKQLLGCLLFFVPRRIWPSKPIGSGSFVLSVEQADFTNVSSPIIAEAIINFGVLGVVFFAVFIARVFSKLDRSYSRLYGEKYVVCEIGKQNLTKLIMKNILTIYPLLMCYSYLIMRGDLLTAWSNTVGFVLPVIILTICTRKEI